MKTLKMITVGVILLLSACNTVPYAAAAGEWTDDFEAAKMAAREQQLPILLNFTGSDWCRGCMMIETNVFTKAEWTDYAKDHLILVTVDLPLEAFMDMRKADPETDALRIQYDITGYPALVLLDNDGETELGRLAGRWMRHMGDYSPENIREWLRAYMHYGSVETHRTASAMGSDDRRAYLDLAQQRKEASRDFRKASTEIAKVRRDGWYLKAEAREEDTAEYERKQINEKLQQLAPAVRESSAALRRIYEQIEEIETEMRAIRVAQLGKDEQEEFQILAKQVAKAKRFQGSNEDKRKYHDLRRRMLLY